jgi:SPW repeat
MWGRVIEAMLGLWLIMSPFIFGHDPTNRPLWSSDLACGAAMVLLALLSFWRYMRYAHLLNLAVASWLIGFGYFYGGHPAAPGYQNDIFVGLILLLLAIIPNEASQPPHSWRRYYQQQTEVPARSGDLQ